MTEPDHISPDERDERAALWCMRLAEAPLEDAEQAVFDRWLAADPRNARAFEEAVAVWNGLDAVTHAPEMIRHRAEAVEALRRSNERRWSRGEVLRGHWPVAAACLALFALLAALILSDSPTRYQTGIGERRMVLLEDGSRLTLDAATRVNVRMDEERRSLELVTGRAKFDVAHDPLRPFSVRAQNRVTVATGTSFSVELLPRQVRVVLYEGRVEVIDQPEERRLPAPKRASAAEQRADRTETALVLKPGNELIAVTDGDAARITEADLARTLSWETGLLSFEGEPLALAAERMNRYARHRIVVRDPHIASYRISGVFAAGDIDAFVEGVTALYPIQAARRADELVLTSDF